MMDRRKPTILVLILSYLGFVSIGLPDGLLGVAWPSIRSSFNLPIDSLGALLVMFTAGYLLSSFGSGWLLARMNVGSLLALSCLATGISLSGYALTQWWSVMVIFGMLAGIGAGAIDAGINTYAAENFSPRTVNWLHAFYGIGATTGPYIMTGVWMANLPWQAGYTIVGMTQLFLAACFALTRNQWLGHKTISATATESVSASRTLRLPAVWLSLAVFFVYTGLEAAAGLWAFSLFTEARGIAIQTAAFWVSVYWMSLTVGRLVSGFVINRVEPGNYLRICIAGIATGAALLWLNFSNAFSFVGLAMMGLFSAPIFPTLIATTPQRLGKDHTRNSIGFQIAGAVLGQSLLPAAIGFFAANMNLEAVGPLLFIAAVVLFVLHEGFGAITSPQTASPRN